MPAAEGQQFGGAVEVVGQDGVVPVEGAGRGLFLVDHETAADGVVGIAMQLAAQVIGDQRHRVGVVGQVLFQEAHVAHPVEGNTPFAGQVQLAALAQFGHARGDLRGIDAIRPFTHQAHDRRAVGAVADAGGRQRAVQAHFDAADPVEQLALAQGADEQRGGAHRADGMRAGRADTDLEQVEHTDSHAGLRKNEVGSGNVPVSALPPSSAVRTGLRCPLSTCFYPKTPRGPGYEGRVGWITLHRSAMAAHAAPQWWMEKRHPPCVDIAPGAELARPSRVCTTAAQPRPTPRVMADYLDRWFCRFRSLSGKNAAPKSLRRASKTGCDTPGADCDFVRTGYDAPGRRQIFPAP
ncbi:hypothetical protein D3C76_902560 [compost metagenome]